MYIFNMKNYGLGKKNIQKGRTQCTVTYIVTFDWKSVSEFQNKCYKNNKTNTTKNKPKMQKSSVYVQRW